MTKTVNRKAAAFLTALKNFAMRNYLMLGYIVAALLIELTGIAVTSGRFYMTSPWLYFTLVAFVCLISLYIPSHTARYILFVTVLFANFAIDLIFIVIYDTTGTIFDYAMFTLGGDAASILETIPFSFAYIFVSGIAIALFATLGFMLRKRMPKPSDKLPAFIATSVLLSLTITANILTAYFTAAKTRSEDLSYMLYRTEGGTYSNRGLIGNFYGEMFRGLWFSDIPNVDADELTRFVYDRTTQPTYYHGIAKDDDGVYNVVTILCESLEWFTFLLDEERYPSGYARMLSKNGGTFEDAASLEAALRELYPNLYRFYRDNSTVVLNNSYALEKTDISENKTIIGNYPQYEYINYAYPDNSVPYSLPNVLDNLYGVTSKSYHDGFKAFYNREAHHTNVLGFESFTASEDMDITDYSAQGERDLDSEMIQSLKAEMFPTDRPFNTFITTITQHGQHAHRKNLEPYYAKMDELGIMPLTGDEHADALRYYLAAGMDLDKAIGIMLDYLEETGLASRTVITLFGDHNCYYQGITGYVKNISGTSAPNYTEMYRVPVMIKVGGNALGNPVINKFTCVEDIYPTLLDLLGITGFSNLMYGTSAFTVGSSVMYSRAYDKFVTDKLYYGSINTLRYRAADADDNYIAEVEEKSLTLLDKISHVNRIFASDYFGGREDDFYSRLRAANGMD